MKRPKDINTRNPQGNGLAKYTRIKTTFDKPHTHNKIPISTHTNEKIKGSPGI